MNAVASTVPAKASTADVEKLLMEIWERMLRVSPIFPDSNFFDLGGDSLLAVSLFLEIERQTGIRLPITAIYDAPTIGEIARLMDDETAPESSPLVLLKSGAGGNPLFILHGIGGTVIELAALGRKIAIAEPVYAIQARGLDGVHPPLKTVEEMADLYATLIRQVQPYGPYWLCGYSFGGLVALEVARGLRAAHQDIAALILMDSFAHPSTWPALSRAKMRARRACHLLRIAVYRPPRETFLLGLRHAKRALGRLASRNEESDARESARLHDWLLDRNPSLPLPLLRVRKAGGAALSTYQPKPYAGAITFLKAHQRDAEFPDDPERIWRRIARHIEFRTMPGGHRTIVTEHADAAAACLTTCVSAARRGPAAQPVHAGSVATALEIASTRRFHSQTL